MYSELSEDFKQFHHHVFGDSRYFHYNGLADEICTNLKAAERKTAEELVLKALSNSSKDERPIRAAGHFRLQPAIPILDKLVSKKKDKIPNNVMAAIVWAKIKIQNDRTILKSLIDFVVNGTKTINDLKREDATDLLSEFGKEPSAVNALLIAFADDDLAIRFSARYALYKLFKEDINICKLLEHKNVFVSSHNELVDTTKKIRDILHNG